MSPDLAFILTLAVRMVVTAAFVVTTSMITERSGPVIGALIATLPISAGPAYVFLALDHDAGFIAEGALASMPVVAATIFLSLTYAVLAQRRGALVSSLAAVAVWILLVVPALMVHWSFAGAILANVVTFAICLPLLARFRKVKMPPVKRCWYDVPLRALLTAGLVASLAVLSSWGGPQLSGMIALFPAVYVCMMLILHMRIGGPPTGALIANGAWGLMGIAIALAELHIAAPRYGSAIALSLGLAICVSWNLALWSLRGRWAAS